MTLELDDLRVRSLGDCRYDSPFAEMLATKRTSPHYVHEDDRVLVDDTVSVLLERGVPIDQLPSLEAAGPRRKVYFDPDATNVGIVTCGGLCPGLNDVIRGIVQELTEHYRVAHIYGFRNGYAGLTPKHRERVVELDLQRRPRHQQRRRHDPRQLARRPGPRRDGRHPRRARDRRPVRHRRRRQHARRDDS